MQTSANLIQKPRRIGVDFDAIRAASQRDAHAICRRVLPGGKLNGVEYVVKNPKRADRTAGSFSVNVRTGAWGDFATGDRGTDMIGLVAFLFDQTRTEAARNLATMLVLNGEVAA